MSEYFSRKRSHCNRWSRNSLSVIGGRAVTAVVVVVVDVVAEARGSMKDNKDWNSFSMAGMD
jgi:hypothetical protein